MSDTKSPKRFTIILTGKQMVWFSDRYTREIENLVKVGNVVLVDNKLNQHLDKDMKWYDIPDYIH